MKSRITLLSLLVASGIPFATAAEAPKAVTATGSDAAITTRAGTETKAGADNPFTGASAVLEKGAGELAVARQRRAIAEQRLGEQRALADMEKLKQGAVIGTVPAGAMIQTTAQ